MDHSLIKIPMIAQSPGDFLRSTGQVFAVFDERTQDSGNISYGVLAGARRFFVKTAGMPGNSKALLSHEQRVALLRNAVSFRRRVDHQGCPELLNVIESPHGPMLVYEWVPASRSGITISAISGSSLFRFAHWSECRR
jgi:serine/threonine-protein kinase